MTIIAGYSVGVHVFSISKALASSLNSYDYFSTAVMQAFQMHITTKTVAKALRAYNISAGKALPWYIRALAITALPCSICFEINRWSSDYQPAFWKKRAIHWICDHMEICTYSIFIVASIALAIVGQPGILLGTITTFSIHQIHNYDILPSYYCRVLTTANELASVCFSQGAFSCLMSVNFLIANLVSNTYFFAQPAQQSLPINTTLILDKAIDDVENNPLHIHYKIELDCDVEEILTIFDEITWEPSQCKELLLQDHFWIKRANIHNTDSLSHILSFRKDIEKFIDKWEACSDANKKKSIELYVKVLIKYLKGYSKSFLQRKKLILRFVAQLRTSQQQGIDSLKKIAEEYYEKIKMLPIEQKILQLLYKKRKEIFTELVNELFAEDRAFYAVASPNFIHFFKPYIQDTFDSHMGINLFPKDEHSALLKAGILGAYADACIPTEQYFCDRESSKFYNPQAIIDVLLDALEADVKVCKKPFCNAITQWCQKQDIEVDLEYEMMQVQKAKQHLQKLAQTGDEYYYQFNALRNIDTPHLDYCYTLIKEDCKKHFQILKQQIEIQGNSEEFAHAICMDVQRALSAYSKIERLLISALLKMEIFHVKP